METNQAKARRGRPRKSDSTLVDAAAGAPVTQRRTQSKAETAEAPSKPQARVEFNGEEAATLEAPRKRAIRTMPKNIEEGTRQKMKLRCMTVNVPEDILEEFELHASRRYDTLTTVVREAMIEYLRTHNAPPELRLEKRDEASGF